MQAFFIDTFYFEEFTAYFFVCLAVTEVFFFNGEAIAFERLADAVLGVMDKIGVKNRCSPYAARLYVRSKPLNTKNAFSAAQNRSGKMAPKMANNATDVCPVTNVSAAGKS